MFASVRMIIHFLNYIFIVYFPDYIKVTRKEHILNPNNTMHIYKGKEHLRKEYLRKKNQSFVPK